MWKGFYPLTIVGIFLAIFVLNITHIGDPDIWWHLATGKYILETGSIPTSDIFSHTVPDGEWIDHEWLSQIAFYVVYELGGFEGIILLKSALVIIAFYFIYKRSSLSYGKIATLLILLSVILVSKDAWLERPMTFTFMFASYFLFVLERERPLWTLPIVTLLWVNLHGGFIIGILLVFLFCVGSLISGETKKGKSLLMILGTCVLVSLANPNSYNILIYPFQYASSSIHTDFIKEWQSPVFHFFSTYEALILLTFVGLGLKRGIDATKMLLLIVFTHFSLFAVRNVSLYGLVCAPIIIGHLEAGIKDVVRKRPLTLIKLSEPIKKAVEKKAVPAFTYTVVILSFALFFFPYLTGAHSFEVKPSLYFPKDAVGYIQENKPEGELYNLYGWGGYCIWTLYPEYKVFIDGRADMYGDFSYEYLTVHKTREGWNDTLDKYNVNLILIDSGGPLDVLLKESEAWEYAYRDRVAVVYTRKPIVPS